MEATMVVIDNSEWTRNGDFPPSRFQSQADAVNLLAGARTQANPENTVGILAMAGKTPRVLVTPTPDLGKVLHSMHDVEIEGECRLATAVQIAQLCLKHRQNKNQRQRVVIFAGSPVSEDKDKLVKIAKKLKKNNVAVDIVSFGASEENEEKFEAFHGAVNSSSNSHLVTVPPGPALTDVLISSPIFQQEGSGYGGGGGDGEGGAGAGDTGGFEFGVDPNLDPELALALRVSLEEERARQNAAAAAAGEAPPDGDKPAEGGDAAPASAAAGAGEDTDMYLTEDDLLQQALAMSMGDAYASTEGAAPAAPASDDTDMTGASDLALALSMSLTDESGAVRAEVLDDPDYINSILASMPGVDVNDPAVKSAVQEAVEALKEASKKDGGDKSMDEDK